VTADAETWRQLLDRLDGHLVAQRTAVEDGRYTDVTAFPAAGDPGPLPPNLVERTRALLAEADAIRDELVQLRDRTARELDLLSNVASRPAAAPAFLDQHA
jgi:hypothetical protein